MTDLTIAIPTYNNPEKVNRFLDSLSEIHIFSHFDVEVLILDNSDNHATKKIVTDFENSKYIRYIKNKENIGPSANTLLCFKKSSGRYLHVMSDKAMLNKTYISTFGDILLRDIKLAYLNYEGIPNNLNITKPVSSVDLDFGSALSTISYGLTHVSSLIIEKNLYTNKFSTHLDLSTSRLPQTHIFIPLLKENDGLTLFKGPRYFIGPNYQVDYSMIEVFYLDFHSIVNPFMNYMLPSQKLKFYFNLSFWILKNLRTIQDIGEYRFFDFIKDKKILFFFYPALFILNLFNDLFLLLKRNLKTNKDIPREY